MEIKIKVCIRRTSTHGDNTYVAVEAFCVRFPPQTNVYLTLKSIYFAIDLVRIIKCYF
jgi:hypothetical protein